MIRRDPFRPRRPVHVKLAVLLLTCILGVLGASYYHHSHVTRSAFLYQLDDRLPALQRYARVLSAPVQRNDGAQVIQLLDLLMDDADMLRVEVLDATVHPIASQESSDYGQVQVERRLVVPLGDNPDQVGDVGWLVAEIGAETLYAMEQQRLRDALLTLLLVIAVMALALAVFQVKVVNRPLRQLLCSIQRSRESGEFVRVGSRLPNDEFGIIIRAYNELLEELDEKHRSLRASESRFRHFYHRTPALLFSLTPGGVIESVSEHFLAHLGYRLEEVKGAELSRFIAQESQLYTLQAQLKKVAQQGRAEAYLQLRNGDGDLHSMRIDMTAGPAGDGILAVMTDITSLDDALSTIERQANFDALTGLPNRHFFKQLLTEQLASQAVRDEGLALLFVDLDRFKFVNDTHGHHTGDKLLTAAAHRIQHYLPAGDFVARLGGDEFAVVVHGKCEEADLLRFSQELIGRLEGSFLIDQCTLHISASVGIALCLHDEEVTPDILLKSADLAMYRAKSEGRGRACVFRPEDEARTLRRVNTESLLREALANDWFELHYQPVFALGGRRMVGAEALVRLHHPEQGLIYPGDFIDVAEETGMIVPLGEWVMREALRQLSQWHRQFATRIYLSINVSGQQLLDNRFCRALERALKQYRMPAAYLILEITESMLMHNTDHTLEVMNRLKKLGCLLSIDDFGTGYSSLSYLQKFPLDILKIDRSFVTDIDENKTHHALVTAILSMSRALDLRVITEGIETQRQLDCLLQMQCELGQGYFFSRPVAAAQIEAQYLSRPPTLSANSG